MTLGGTLIGSHLATPLPWECQAKMQYKKDAYVTNPRTWAGSHLATPLHMGMQLYPGQCLVCLLI